MDKGSNGRDGKIVSGGHSTRVEGVNHLLRELVTWAEITTIRLGGIEHKKTVGRKSKKLKVDASSENGLRAAQPHKRANGRGGFTFKATRLAMVGNRVIGINCHASHGTMTQLIVLSGNDLHALKLRLHAAGYGANW